MGTTLDFSGLSNFAIISLIVTTVKSIVEKEGRINRIKRIRTATNWGLKDAKDFSDLFNPISDLLEAKEKVKKKFAISWWTRPYDVKLRIILEAETAAEAVVEAFNHLRNRGVELPVKWFEVFEYNEEVPTLKMDKQVYNNQDDDYDWIPY